MHSMLETYRTWNSNSFKVYEGTLEGVKVKNLEGVKVSVQINRC